MKILFVSDTHGKHKLLTDLPEADIFIHCGDFMNSGMSYYEIDSFNNWLETVPVPKEMRWVVAGNHDVFFDAKHKGSSPGISREAKKKLTNGVYIQDEDVTYRGIKFYFSPWTPSFFGWGFNADRGEDIKKYWDLIPLDTNVLVTHGPPYDILDQIKPGKSEHLGCEELKKKIERLPDLKIHAFGHIHGSRGVRRELKTDFINASFLNEQYAPHTGKGYTLIEL